MRTRTVLPVAIGLIVAGCAATDEGLQGRLDRGKAAVVSGDYEDAAEALTAVAGEGLAVGNRTVQTDALTWLGILARRQGDYEQALELGERALALKLEHGVDSLLARSYNSLGLLAWEEGRLVEAEEHLRRGREVAERFDQKTVLAAIAGNQGLVDLDFGRFSEARQAFDTFAEVSLAMDSLRFYANALTNIAMWAVASGRAGEAFEPGEQALEIYRVLDIPSRQQQALAHLADAYRAVGQPAAAQKVLEQAMVLADQLGERPEQARNLEARARLFWDVGETSQALDWFARAQAEYEDMGQPVELGKTLRSMAEIHVHLENLELAYQLAEDALTLHIEAGDRYEEFFDRLLLGEIARRQHRDDLVNHMLDLADSVWAHDGSAATRHALALSRAAHAIDRGGAALARQALVPVLDQTDIAEPSVRAEAYRLRAASFGLENRWDSASAWGRRSVDQIDQVRQQAPSASAMTTFTARRTQSYTDLVHYLQSAGRWAEAFAISDRLRGQTILREIGLIDPALLPSQDPLVSLSEADALDRQIEGLTDLLTDPEPWMDEPTVEAMVATRASSSARRERLLTGVSAAAPGAVSFLGAIDADVEEIQAALGPDEALVEYLVGDSATTLFVLTAEGLSVGTSPVTRRDLSDRVRIARELLSDADAPAENAAGVLEALYEGLWDPVESQLAGARVSRILLVPHTFLNYLPFAALRNPDTGAHLIEERELITLPSASVLPVLRSRTEWAAEERGVVSLFAPKDRLLPHTRDETRAIEQVLPGAREYVGAQATESAFREAFGTSSLLHVATHGALNPQNPMFSRLELASEGVGDGFLEVHEVLSMKGESRLVFLSGCETGAGSAGTNRFAPGDDLATLAQAFLYAGAQNVVATLWSIQDESAARFAAWFYESLATKSPAAALREAQLRALKDPVLSSPYYWASYQLSGGGGH